jgi:hypothetical protein
MMNVLKEFEQRFNKTYANKEETDMRMNILKTNLRKVFKHNANAYNGKKSYTIGVNKFSDMSFEEIINSSTGLKPTKYFTNVVKAIKSTSKTRYYTNNTNSWSIDPYREKYVTPVQHQVRLNWIKNEFSHFSLSQTIRANVVLVPTSLQLLLSKVLGLEREII